MLGLGYANFPKKLRLLRGSVLFPKYVRIVLAEIYHPKGHSGRISNSINDPPGSFMLFWEVKMMSGLQIIYTAA
jgi:hypothetical protein